VGRKDYGRVPHLTSIHAHTNTNTNTHLLAYTLHPWPSTQPPTLHPQCHPQCHPTAMQPHCASISNHHTQSVFTSNEAMPLVSKLALSGTVCMFALATTGTSRFVRAVLNFGREGLP